MPPGSAARTPASTPGAEPGAAERHAPRVADRDPVGAEDLREQRRAGVPRTSTAISSGATPSRISSSTSAPTISASARSPPASSSRTAPLGARCSPAGLEQAALEVMQRGPRDAGVVVGALGQLDHLRARSELLHRRGAAGQRVAPGLVGQRDADLGAGEPRERVDRVELRRVSSSKP